MSTPSTMKALVVCQWPKAKRIANLAAFRHVGAGVASIQEVPVPIPEDNQVLVKVTAVALNPTDWKHIAFLSPSASIVGCDYAGTIEKVSKNNPNKWKIGDRVAGATHGGMYPDKGSFAEYLVMDDDLAFRVPEDVSELDAPTFGVSPLTAMLALNQHLEVPWPDEKPAEKVDGKAPSILIYAGSTATGISCIQFAKLAGYEVVTTCSPHSFELVKSYGADAVYDYRSATAMQDIKKAFPNIRKAVDCISESGSTKKCIEAMASSDAKIITLLPGGSSQSGVEVKPIMAYTLMGKEFQFFAPIGPRFPAVPEDRAAAARLANIAGSFLGKTVRAPPVQEVPGGWNGLLDGLNMLREGKVSGKKLVVRIPNV